MQKEIMELLTQDQRIAVKHLEAVYEKLRAVSEAGETLTEWERTDLHYELEYSAARLIGYSLNTEGDHFYYEKEA